MTQEKNKMNRKNLRYGIIEVTAKCQCVCPGCYMVRRKALNQIQMNYDQAVLILDLCKEFIGTELETMDILGGEPLLWPHLKKYITELLNRGISPWIFTNMLAITPELAKWLFERKIHVTGKLNVNPEDPSQIKIQAEMLGGNSSTVEKLFSSIKVFQKVGYTTPLLSLENLVRIKNIELVPNYYAWCLKNKIRPDIELMASGEPIDQKYWDIAPKPEQIVVMINKIQKIRKEFGLPSTEILVPHIFGNCRFYNKGLYFTVSGNIRACSNSTSILSSIYEVNPIIKAWNHELMCNRRNLYKEKMGEPCGSCKFWNKCKGGCRATAENKGDSFAGYPICPVPYLK